MSLEPGPRGPDKLVWQTRDSRGWCGEGKVGPRLRFPGRRKVLFVWHSRGIITGDGERTVTPWRLAGVKFVPLHALADSVDRLLLWIGRRIESWKDRRKGATNG